MLFGKKRLSKKVATEATTIKSNTKWKFSGHPRPNVWDINSSVLRQRELSPVLSLQANTGAPITGPNDRPMTAIA